MKSLVVVVFAGEILVWLPIVSGSVESSGLNLATTLLASAGFPVLALLALWVRRRSRR